jgi:tight adherence protein B
VNVVVIVVLAAAGSLAGYGWYWERTRRRALARLDVAIGTASPAEILEPRRAEQERTQFPPRFRWVPPVIGAGIAIGLRWSAALPLEIAVAAGLLVGVLSHLAEASIAEQRVLRIESQLTDAIDLLIASVRAGAAVLAAFEIALQETRPPLRSYLQEVVGRIRLGDDPPEVITGLSTQIPLETFRLFSLSLAVHWEVGGSLAATLATVGRTIRDRIELSRRVRAQGIEANLSVGAVLAIAYLLGYLMWRSSPERTEAFFRSGAGSEITAAVIVLQAIGLIWMSRVSRSGF